MLLWQESIHPAEANDHLNRSNCGSTNMEMILMTSFVCSMSTEGSTEGCFGRKWGYKDFDDGCPSSAESFGRTGPSGSCFFTTSAPSGESWPGLLSDVAHVDAMLVCCSLPDY